MADIELVIKISEEDYKALINVNDSNLSSIIARRNLYEALKNGTPLEQEHCEDAIGRHAAIEQTYNWSKDEFLRVTNPFYYLRKRINALPSVNTRACDAPLEYLETAYTGARACDDVAEQIRLARAIEAYKQDVHEDCTLSQARKNGLWIVEKGDRSTGYGGGLIVCSRCSTEGQAEWWFCQICGAKMTPEWMVAE